MKLKRIIGLAVSALVLSPGYSWGVELLIDGFASMIAGKVLDKDELRMDKDVRRSYLGYDHELSFKPESLFAIQFHSDLSEGLSATAQVVAEGSNDYDAEFVWAFMSYHFTPEWTLKLGRFRAPFFQFSDSIDVGYSYPWISLPHDVYDLRGIENVEGLSMQYESVLDAWTSTLTLVAGNSESHVVLDGTPVNIEANDVVNLSWRLNYDGITLHISRAVAKGSIDIFNQLEMALLAFQVPLTPKEMDELNFSTDLVHFTGIGITADYGNWLTIAEFA